MKCGAGFHPVVAAQIHCTDNDLSSSFITNCNHAVLHIGHYREVRSCTVEGGLPC